MHVDVWFSAASFPHCLLFHGLRYALFCTTALCNCADDSLFNYLPMAFLFLFSYYSNIFRGCALIFDSLCFFLTWQSPANPATTCCCLSIQHNVFLVYVEPRLINSKLAFIQSIQHCFRMSTGQTGPTGTISDLSARHLQFFASGFHLTVNFNFRCSPRILLESMGGLLGRLPLLACGFQAFLKVFPTVSVHYFSAVFKHILPPSKSCWKTTNSAESFLF